MNRSHKHFDSALRNPGYIAAFGLASIVSVTYYMHSAGTLDDNPKQFIVSVLFLSALIIGFAYSIKVRSDNIAIRRAFRDLHEINKIYRIRLAEEFGVTNDSSADHDRDALIRREAATLRAVLQRISRIFTTLTARSCIASIDLLTQQDTRLFAECYMRSEDMSLRDISSPTILTVREGLNSEFDEALNPLPHGMPPHYFASDLRHSLSYVSQRHDYLRFFKSILTVPIYSSLSDDELTNRRGEVIGFLSIDSLSVNRLNSSDHLFLLSALASQMFNFMSIMRGGYAIHHAHKSRTEVAG